MTHTECLEQILEAGLLLESLGEAEERRAHSHDLLSEAMGLDANDVETYSLMEMAAKLITEYKLKLITEYGLPHDPLQQHHDAPYYSSEGDSSPTYPWMSGFQGEPQPVPELELPDTALPGFKQLAARISAIEKTQSDFFDQIDHIGERIRVATSDHDLAEDGFGDRPGSGDGHGRRARQLSSKKSRA